MALWFSRSGAVSLETESVREATEAKLWGLAEKKSVSAQNYSKSNFIATNSYVSHFLKHMAYAKLDEGMKLLLQRAVAVSGHPNVLHAVASSPRCSRKSVRAATTTCRRASAISLYPARPGISSVQSIWSRW